MEEELATCLRMAATMLNRTPRDRFQAKVDAVGLSAGPHVFRRLRPLALDAEAHEQTEAPPDQNLQEPISVDGSGIRTSGPRSRQGGIHGTRSSNIWFLAAEGRSAALEHRMVI